MLSDDDAGEPPKSHDGDVGKADEVAPKWHARKEASRKERLIKSQSLFELRTRQELLRLPDEVIALRNVYRGATEVKLIIAEVATKHGKLVNLRPNSLTRIGSVCRVPGCTHRLVYSFNHKKDLWDRVKMSAHSCTGFTPFEERKSQFNYEPIHFVKVLHKDVLVNMNIPAASIGALPKPHVAQDSRAYLPCSEQYQTKGNQCNLRRPSRGSKQIECHCYGKQERQGY